MDEAIAILEKLRRKIQDETWSDRKAQDCTIGGITMSIGTLKTRRQKNEEKQWNGD